jgi:glycosyltransferase involved in cell wall biosynthesis
MTFRSDTPLVSVIIPVYNGANFIQEAIESVLSQSYKNVEVVVVNDGSNDEMETQKAVKVYEKYVEIHNKSNGGCASALNYGLKKMRGNFFSWLSHDDLYSKEKIASQVELVLGKPSNTLVYSNYSVINETGRILQRNAFENSFKKEVLIDSYLPLALSLINGCTLLIPKELLFTGFDTKYQTTQDYEKWREIFPRSEMVFCEYSGVYSRRHSKQDSLTNPRHTSEADSFWLKCIKDIKQRDINSTLLDDLEMLFLTNYHLKDSNYSDSKSILTESLIDIHNLDNSGIANRNRWITACTQRVLMKIAK